MKFIAILTLCIASSAFAFTPFPARFVGRSTSIVSATRAELVKVSEAEQKKITDTLSLDSTAEEVEAALAKYYEAHVAKGGKEDDFDRKTTPEEATAERIAVTQMVKSGNTVGAFNMILELEKDFEAELDGVTEKPAKIDFDELASKFPTGQVAGFESRHRSREEEIAFRKNMIATCLCTDEEKVKLTKMLIDDGKFPAATKEDKKAKKEEKADADE